MQDPHIEPNRRLRPLALAGSVLTQICSHAVETFPEECCGLVTGGDRERFREVHRCRNEMTLNHRQDPALYPRDGTQAFWMSELDYLAIVKQAEERGDRVTGVYHSHVGVGAYFSELDQEFASQDLFPFPDADHIVVSIVDRVVKELASFRWLPEERRFQGRVVEAQT